MQSSSQTIVSREVPPATTRKRCNTCRLGMNRLRRTWYTFVFLVFLGAFGLVKITQRDIHLRAVVAAVLSPLGDTCSRKEPALSSASVKEELLSGEEIVKAALNEIDKDKTVSGKLGGKFMQQLGEFISKYIKEVGKLKCEGVCGEAEGSTRRDVKGRTSEIGNDRWSPDLAPIYVITPTYRRPEQIPELTRVSQTLMQVKNVFWIVVEDATEKTPLVAELLKRTGLMYEHLTAQMPQIYTKIKGAKPRGVSNRLKGLEWIRQNADSGVLYFADDDNTYDIRLFEEMRDTRKVSMFPVGLVTTLGISTPIVKEGKVVGFYDGWVAGRKFPVDMAGFAVSVKYLKQHPNATMPYQAGREEDGFLKSLKIQPTDIEAKADGCTQILVWHTQAKKNSPAKPLDVEKFAGTNLISLRKQIV